MGDKYDLISKLGQKPNKVGLFLQCHSKTDQCDLEAGKMV